MEQLTIFDELCDEFRITKPIRLIELFAGYGSQAMALKRVGAKFEQWFIEKYKVKLCRLYYPPFNFDRTGCKGCPFALHLQNQLEVMEHFLPRESNARLFGNLSMKNIGESVID